MLKHVSNLAVAAIFVCAASSTTALAGEGEHKVAVVMATTGPAAFVGVPATNGMKLAEDHLRAKNFFGDVPFTVTYDDNRTDKQEAITLLTRIARDSSYDLFMGPISTSEALAAAPAAVDLEMPMFTTGTSPEILEAGHWVFKSAENASDFIRPLGDYIASEVGPDACYVVSIRDNEAYLIYSDVFSEAVHAGGTEIVASDTILSSDSDFTALATKIVNSGADCLYISTYPEVGANLLLQARQAGLPADSVIVGNQNMASDKYISTGGEVVEGTYLLAEFSPHAATGMGETFVQDYTERFGQTPDTWAAVGYSMMRIVAHALREAGPDATRDEIRQAMASSTDIPVVIGSGKWSLDENRVPQFGAMILQIRDGKAVRPE